MTTMLKACAALLCAMGASPFAVSQMTSVTAAAGSLRIGGHVISTGTAYFTPVNVNGIPVPFSTGGGGLNAPVALTCPISSGGLSGCTVPDTSLTQPGNLLYLITIADTSTGQPTSGQSFTLQAVSGVSGSTWALDHYAPSVTYPMAGAMTYTQGIGAPVGTWGQNSFYADITNLTAPVLYTSVNGTMVQVAGTGSGTTSGALTANYLPKATGSSSLANSSISSDGTTTTIRDASISLPASLTTLTAQTAYFQGAYFFANFNQQFWADGFPLAGCTVAGVNYPDQASCAWYTADNYKNTNGTTVAINWGCKTYQTNWPTGLVATSLPLGATIDQHAACASTRVYKSPGTILQAGSGVTANQLMTYPVTTGTLPNPIVIDGVSIDGNNVTPACWWIKDTGYSRYSDMGCRNTAAQTASGGADFEFGNTLEGSSNNSQEDIYTNIVDTGGGVGGEGQENLPATLTVNLSGGTIPVGTSSITVNSGGSYGNLTGADLSLYLYGIATSGTGFNTAPCTSPGTYSLTTTSGGLTQVNILTAYTGCPTLAGSVSAQVHQTPTHDYGGIFDSSDSQINEVVVAGNFNVAAMWLPFGTDDVHHPHLQTWTGLALLDNGTNHISALEADKVTNAIEETGPDSIIEGTMMYQVGANQPGGSFLTLTSAATGTKVFGMFCRSGDTTPNYHNILTPTGPMEAGYWGQGAFPSTAGKYVDIHGIGTCNHVTSPAQDYENTPIIINTLSVGYGANVVYRCTAAGTGVSSQPVGALTTVPANCGASVATSLSVN